MTDEAVTPLVQSSRVDPSVGVFWRVETVIVIDRITLAEAEPYGDFLTSRGHHEVWDEWKRFGVGGLKKRGMPSSIAWSEYEEFPRGRVVYDTVKCLFTVFADRRLQRAGVIAEIVELFGISGAKYVVRSDSHYR